MGNLGLCMESEYRVLVLRDLTCDLGIYKLNS